MSDLAKKEQGDLLPYLFGKEAGSILPQPFERDIFLFDTYVAGTTHIEGMDRIGESLQADDRVNFFREPQNPHDPQAIRVETMGGQKIGYIPQQDNIVFSRLMDAGKELFGRLLDKELLGNWWKIRIRIYLHER